MKSARENMDIIAAYQQVGTYRGAAVMCGTTHKTVKRIIERAEAGGKMPDRAGRGRNYDLVAELVADRVGVTKGRISAKRLLPAARAAGYAGSARNFRRLVAEAKRRWRRDNHRGRRPAVWTPGEVLAIDWGSTGPLHVFCAVLAWSRFRFVRFAGPVIGSAWESVRPGQPRPLDSGTFALVALPTSPFWARRYTRSFLDSCKGMGEDAADMAELIVSELVTNAVRFAGNPTRTLRYSERANASLISLSIRHFREGLLIEVYDTDSNPPIRSHAEDYAESGRGLMLVEALSKEWSYFFPPGGGKVVYCFLEIR